MDETADVDAELRALQAALHALEQEKARLAAKYDRRIAAIEEAIDRLRAPHAEARAPRRAPARGKKGRS